MKSSSSKCRERQVKEASHRMSAILTRSAGLGVDLRAVDSVSLVYGGNKAAAPVLSLLLMLVLTLASVHLLLNHVTSCHHNTNKPPQEFHIKTIGWDHLHLEGKDIRYESSALIRDLEHPEEIPLWRPWQKRRDR